MRRFVGFGPANDKKGAAEYQISEYQISACTARFGLTAASLRKAPNAAQFVTIHSRFLRWQG